MKKLLLSIAAAGAILALAACASPQNAKDQGKKIANKGDVVCFHHTAIGSHIGKVICMSKQDYLTYQKAKKQAAEGQRGKLRRTNTRALSQSCSDTGTC